MYYDPSEVLNEESVGRITALNFPDTVEGEDAEVGQPHFLKLSNFATFLEGNSLSERKIHDLRYVCLRRCVGHWKHLKLCTLTYQRS